MESMTNHFNNSKRFTHFATEFMKNSSSNDKEL